MRKFFQVTLACCLLLMLSHSSFGQQGTRLFPWRAQRGQVPAQQSSTTIINSQGNPTTVPPIVQPGQPARSILKQDQQEGEAAAQQESAAQQYQFGNTPSANGQDAYQSMDPALSVQSNAIAENCGFCQEDCFHSIGCPHRIFGNVSGLDIGGWTQFGYHSDSTGLFNDRPDELNLHQFWLYAGRAANCNRRFGYRMDAVYGIDAQNVQAFGNPPTGNPSGWDNGWDNGAYGWALPQAYVETYLPNRDETIRIGKFLSPFGCEKIPSVENFFYSRTFTRNFTEPFTMTGVIAERNLGQNSSYILGATLGWDTGFDSDSGFNVLTGARFQLTPNINVRATSSWGDTGRRRGSGTLNSVITSVKLLPNVFYTAQVDMLNLNVDSNDEYALVNYLTYRASDVVAWGGRLEWWKSDQFSVDTQSTYSATFGANVRPHSNIVIRPEIRYDWGAQAFNDNVSIFGIDAIILF